MLELGHGEWLAVLLQWARWHEEAAQAEDASVGLVQLRLAVAWSATGVDVGHERGARSRRCGSGSKVAR